MKVKFKSYSFQKKMSRTRHGTHPIWIIISIVVIFNVLTSAIFWKFILGIGSFLFALKMMNSYNKMQNQEIPEKSYTSKRVENSENETPDYDVYEEEDEEFYFDLDQPMELDDLDDIIEEKHKMFK